MSSLTTPRSTRASGSWANPEWTTAPSATPAAVGTRLSWRMNRSADAGRMFRTPGGVPSSSGSVMPSNAAIVAFLSQDARVRRTKGIFGNLSRATGRR
jgi:hypothetical protein